MSNPGNIRDTASVIALPPLLFLGALMLALLLNAFAPMSVAPCRRSLLWLIGTALIAIGLALSAAVVWTFRKSRTPVSLRRPTRSIVREGPYRFSRNPDYVGQVMIYLGAAVATDSWWPFFLLPLLGVAIHWGVVLREEHYLEAKFAQEYRDYKARVRRWL